MKIMVYKFTSKAKKVIEIANDISIELGHNYIGTEHIFLGILSMKKNYVCELFNSFDITYDVFSSFFSLSFYHTFYALSFRRIPLPTLSTKPISIRRNITDDPP